MDTYLSSRTNTTGTTMQRHGLAGYMVEATTGRHSYMTIPEFAALCALRQPELACGLYYDPQAECSHNIEVTFLSGCWLPAAYALVGAVPLWRGAPVGPPYFDERIPDRLPPLVLNHLLFHRPDMCPQCRGNHTQYCPTCGHGCH